MTRRLALLALATALALPFAAAPAAAGDGEMPECLANPGVEDVLGFTHQIQIFLDDREWYLLGPELELDFDQQGQPQDMPGHCWDAARPAGDLLRYIGKHYNTGPLNRGGPPRWWSSTAPDHAMLYWVDIVISKWSPETAAQRGRDGYVHYHELVRKDDGCHHPNKVAWLKHTAVKEFSFDGGPPQQRPDGRLFRPRNEPHDVHPGLDFAFPPNYDIQYLPERGCLPE